MRQNLKRIVGADEVLQASKARQEFLLGVRNDALEEFFFLLLIECREGTSVLRELPVKEVPCRFIDSVDSGECGMHSVPYPTSCCRTMPDRCIQ